MNLNIDPQNLQVCMKLWKEALTHTIPMATEFQIHFIQERPTILGNYERTASAWLMMLRPATPADGDKEAHAALIAGRINPVLVKPPASPAPETGRNDALADDAQQSIASQRDFFRTVAPRFHGSDADPANLGGFAGG